MSTIAGEGTSSDGSEVTMTAPESERTDAETTGTTGQNSKRNTRLSTLLSHHFFCMLWCACPCVSDFCFLLYYDQRVGPGEGASQSWRVPGLWQRPEGEVHPAKARHESPAETHEKRLVRWKAMTLIRLELLSVAEKPWFVRARDDHGGDPYRGGYDMGYSGGGGPSYGPPQHWGHPDLHLMQPHHGIPIQARWEMMWWASKSICYVFPFLHTKMIFLSGLATSMTWI